MVENNEEKSDLELDLRKKTHINHKSVYVKTNENYEDCDHNIF